MTETLPLGPSRDQKPITAAEIRMALVKRYPHPAYGIVFEVAAATGTQANRHLDAMAMGLWPSRGLTLDGIEIKINRSDWLRELKNPAKAEELARFCHHFYVAAPMGIVKPGECPPNWGVLELTLRRQLTEIKVPTRNADAPSTYPPNFLAAVFRAANRPVGADEIEAAVAERMKGAEATIMSRIEQSAAQRRDDNKVAADRWLNMVKELADAGLDVGSLAFSARYVSGSVERAIVAVHKSGVANTYNGLLCLKVMHEQALKRLEDGIALLNVEAAAKS